MPSFLQQCRAIRLESDGVISLIVSELPVASQHRLLTNGRLSSRPATLVRRIASEASCFTSKHNAGALSRAYYANCVRWGLKDKGYSEAFVNSIAASIVVAMQASDL